MSATAASAATAAAPTRYEAEAAPATCSGTIDSNWAGYSGTGFCNATNAVGAAAQFTVNAATAGTATVGVRFANGTTTARPAEVIVNGSTVQNASFEGTGAWTTWVTKTLTVSVNQGSNTIRFSPTNAAGLPNIDYLDFEVGSGSSGPVIPGLYADPHITYLDGRYYIYPTTDGFVGWTGTYYKAFSSTDLVNWTDHGVILDLRPDVSWADSSAWAPAIAAKNGKYYFYFSGGASSTSAKQIGVAVADSPTGPFRDALGRPLVRAGQFPGQTIDPMVFTDDNGQSYLYWGQGTANVVPLNSDMISFDSTKVRSFRPTGYNEGAFVVKRNGVYYFMWSEGDTRSEDYRVAYATGSSPMGPWTKRGVILQKRLDLGIKGTGHHSVVRVPGTDTWYMAYHRFAIPGGDGYHREVMINRMNFNSDGTIQPVVPTR
ncbi:family 43 glycosylhydrolase [Allorhizocola rhizosphaerae]|uniref:family 43 glycosylhydrolase n=1 Tax=Allorhizocola rhizosphaerae TaxID=1872709 RepID=UPI001FE947B2|nr:family 43 glycosylhydrolase [Allorhizocola rhizosphaerae]